ncbi:MAG: hypothetical protein J3K34DRAFT_16930 [Monoraphidium minutum]|nr:MAG: hypothetical protein J3K34DRAFT_16930 [Monoraphidium minutum]
MGNPGRCSQRPPPVPPTWSCPSVPRQPRTSPCVHIPLPLLALPSTTLPLTLRLARPHAAPPPKAPQRRYYFCGMREVRKAVRSGGALAVVIAPNIDVEQAESEALEEQISGILGASAAGGVPVVFALSRKRLGEIWGARKRMSAIAVVDAGGGGGGGEGPAGAGAAELLARALELAADGRRRWEAEHATGGGAAGGSSPAAAGRAVAAQQQPPALPTVAAQLEDEENDDDALL